MASARLSQIPWPMVIAMVTCYMVSGNPAVTCDVQLNHLSTVYLPSQENAAPVYDDSAVEQIAVDTKTDTIYAVGNKVYHVISMSDQGQLTTRLTRFDPTSDFTDVEVCGGHVFMTVANGADPASGTLRVFRLFTGGEADPLPLVADIPVGFGPDMLALTSDCLTAVVAVEAEGYVDGATVVDPEGGVAIVHLPDGPIHQNNTTVKLLNFRNFNDRYGELAPSGVRFVYRENNNKFSADVEPEYIAIDEETRTAYVCLQENNAIAVVDLKEENITQIHGLGYKSLNYLDASDKDGGIRISYWPLRAWYTPDTLKLHTWHGQKLLVTANEGDYKEVGSFEEATKSISTSDLGGAIHPLVKAAIVDDNLLGRLKLSKADGKDPSGKYEALYAYGGRSFSIWSVPDPSVPSGGQALTQLFDSGSQLEQLTAQHCPHLFNTDGDEVDDRSDNKGPEPESIAMGEISGRLYIFVGNERPGVIFVYSVGHDVTEPRFETIFCDGIPDNGRTMEQKFAERSLYGVDPEDMRFVPAESSPTGRPILLVAGTVSGTVTVLEVKVTNTPGDQDTEGEDRENLEACVKGKPDSGTFLGASFTIIILSTVVHLW